MGSFCMNTSERERERERENVSKMQGSRTNYAFTKSTIHKKWRTVCKAPLPHTEMLVSAVLLFFAAFPQSMEVGHGKESVQNSESSPLWP